MPYCEKCGNNLADGAMFCSKCGNSVNTLNVAPIPDQNVADLPKESSSKKSFMSKRLLALLLSIVVVIIAIVTVVLLVSGDSVVTKNEDGETVFTFTLSNFVDRYNENSDYTLSVDDFEKNEEGYELYEGDFYISVDVSFGNYPCYASSVYMTCYTDNGIPDKAVDVVQAIYPDMSDEEVRKQLGRGQDGRFDDVTLYYHDREEIETWHFFPFIP